MCIAIYKPAGKKITKKILRSCFATNPDGAGMMYIEKDRLVTHKGFFAFRKFYKQFRDYEREFPKTDFVLHCRIATSGKIDVNTCHPFRVHDQLAFVHNGVFTDFSHVRNKGLSDTQLFNKKILQKYPSNFLDIPEINEALQKYCTAGFSKLVFMDGKGRVTIFNESGGSWVKGVWYSHRLMSWAIERMTASTTRTKTEYDSDGGNDRFGSCELCSTYYKEKDLTEYGIQKMLLCKDCLTEVCTTPDVDIICPYCGCNSQLEDGLCSRCMEYIPPDERMNTEGIVGVGDLT